MSTIVRYSPKTSTQENLAWRKTLRNLETPVYETHINTMTLTKIYIEHLFHPV